MIKESESNVIDIIEGLKNIGLKAAEKELTNATFAVLHRLEEIGLKCTEKKLDGVSPKEVGFMGAGQFFSATEEVLDALREVGIKAADKKLEKFNDFPVAEVAIAGLYKIGLHAIDSDLSVSTVSKSCYGLFEIGKKVVEKKIGSLGNQTRLLFILSSEIKSEDNYGIFMGFRRFCKQILA